MTWPFENDTSAIVKKFGQVGVCKRIRETRHFCF